jgi:hypothetical protein
LTEGLLNNLSFLFNDGGTLLSLEGFIGARATREGKTGQQTESDEPANTGANH